MNIHPLTETETSYLLFAIKKTLRDRTGLTPDMEQFYDSTYEQLSAKLSRLQGRDGPPERSRDSYVSVTWHPDSLSRVSKDLAGDT
jgi:hypothetical protein